MHIVNNMYILHFFICVYAALAFAIVLCKSLSQSIILFVNYLLTHVVLSRNSITRCAFVFRCACFRDCAMQIAFAVDNSLCELSPNSCRAVAKSNNALRIRIPLRLLSRLCYANRFRSR